DPSSPGLSVATSVSCGVNISTVVPAGVLSPLAARTIARISPVRGAGLTNCTAEYIAPESDASPASRLTAECSDAKPFPTTHHPTYEIAAGRVCLQTDGVARRTRARECQTPSGPRTGSA